MRNVWIPDKSATLSSQVVRAVRAGFGIDDIAVHLAVPRALVARVVAAMRRRDVLHLVIKDARREWLRERKAKRTAEK